jgi:hypothetical protein
VEVPKEKGKVRVFVDFRDLNKASPKDNFSLPHIDILVDNIANNLNISLWMDFLGIIKLVWWRIIIIKKPFSSCIGKPFVTKSCSLD